MDQIDLLNPLKNITLRLPEEQVTELIEWFDANSKPSLSVNEEAPINAITIKKFKEFLNLKKYHKRHFHYPSYDEIMREVEKLKAEVFRLLTKEQFIFLIDKWIIEANIKHETKLAFEVFDTENRNFMDIDQIAVIVQSYADIFNEEETREFLRDANVRGDGNVFYEDFVESLFSVAPELYQLETDFLYENPDDDPSVPPEPESNMQDDVPQSVVDPPKPAVNKKPKKKQKY